jgi:hypothetical protein
VRIKIAENWHFWIRDLVEISGVLALNFLENVLVGSIELEIAEDGCWLLWIPVPVS